MAPPPPPPPPPPAPAAGGGAPAPPPPPPPPAAGGGGSAVAAPPPPPPPAAAMAPIKPIVQEVEVSEENMEITDVSIPDSVDVSETTALSGAKVTIPSTQPAIIPGKVEDDVVEKNEAHTNDREAAQDTVDASERPKGTIPMVHGTYTKNEGEEEVMVKTEFVWADGAQNDVKLSGAWNGWMTIQMYHEGGGMWSVVTPVPAGVHEFKFVVDGEWRHSTRHPTVGDQADALNNVRMIRGPPKTAKKEEERGEGDEAPQKKSCCVIS